MRLRKVLVSCLQCSAVTAIARAYLAERCSSVQVAGVDGLGQDMARSKPNGYLVWDDSRSYCSLVVFFFKGFLAVHRIGVWTHNHMVKATNMIVASCMSGSLEFRQPAISSLFLQAGTSRAVSTSVKSEMPGVWKDLSVASNGWWLCLHGGCKHAHQGCQSKAVEKWNEKLWMCWYGGFSRRGLDIFGVQIC